MKFTQKNTTTVMTMTLLGALVLTAAKPVLADGMIPETSVVIVNEADGEATMKVTNSDAVASLLHVKVLDIPEDKEPLLLVTPSVARVEAGKTQQVRFILRTGNAPLKTQRMKRASFEGIASQKRENEAGESRVGVGVRQNLPVIIHPKGLARNDSPWTGLQWSLANGKLTVSNPTAYVVRLSPDVTLMPSQTRAQMTKSYVLPGEKLDVSVTGAAASASAVRFVPATVYGFAVKHYDASLNGKNITR
ncbi:fimbria/pilus periplasmic chaperone [Buttiauxella sp. S04-F03]|nr:fimbria/pilus chaperone family protein [Buttiauxella sp. W03-F01]MCE0798957.1 fimbria/pilus periplasmic chaperone [Buttiauxella sp. W03-F01]